MIRRKTSALPCAFRIRLSCRRTRPGAGDHLCRRGAVARVGASRRDHDYRPKRPRRMPKTANDLNALVAPSTTWKPAARFRDHRRRVVSRAVRARPAPRPGSPVRRCATRCATTRPSCRSSKSTSVAHLRAFDDHRLGDRATAQRPDPPPDLRASASDARDVGRHSLLIVATLEARGQDELQQIRGTLARTLDAARRGPRTSWRP